MHGGYTDLEAEEQQLCDQWMFSGLASPKESVLSALHYFEKAGPVNAHGHLLLPNRAPPQSVPVLVHPY